MMPKTNLQIDPNGFICADGVKICRLDPSRGLLLFLDKDRRRSAERGTDQVAVTVADLVQIAKNAPIVTQLNPSATT